MFTLSRITNQIKRINGLTPIGRTLAAVMREIFRRSDLRQRLEAERGRPLSDGAFLKLAERTGVTI